MISVKNVTKKYGDKIVLQNLSLDIENGEILAVLGASGVGKTTLLKMLSGIEEYDGEISGAPDKKSYSFQEDRLIKNLTAAENIAYVLSGEKREKIAKARDFLINAELGEFLDLYPKELSGGMARRVSLARAFAYGAPLLLMDEPFSGQDIALKSRLIEYFKKMWEKDKPTTIIVTHSPYEAMLLSSRIIILENKKIAFDKRASDTNQEEIISVLTRL